MPEEWDLKRVLTPLVVPHGAQGLLESFSSFPTTPQLQIIQETVKIFTFLANKHNLSPFKQEFSQEVFFT